MHLFYDILQELVLVNDKSGHPDHLPAFASPNFAMTDGITMTMAGAEAVLLEVAPKFAPGRLVLVFKCKKSRGERGDV